jgi:hypothetical protein
MHPPRGKRSRTNSLLTAVPDGVLKSYISYLAVADLCAVGGVSVSLNTLSNSNGVWQALCTATWSNSSNLGLTSFKNYYIKRLRYEPPRPDLQLEPPNGVLEDITLLLDVSLNTGGHTPSIHVLLSTAVPMTSMKRGGSLTVTSEVDWSVLQPLVNQVNQGWYREGVLRAQERVGLQKFEISVILLRRSDQKTITLMTKDYELDSSFEPHLCGREGNTEGQSCCFSFDGPSIEMKSGSIFRWINEEESYLHFFSVFRLEVYDALHENQLLQGQLTAASVAAEGRASAISSYGGGVHRPTKPKVDTRKARMDVMFYPFFYNAGGCGDTRQMACALNEAIWED